MWSRVHCILLHRSTETEGQPRSPQMSDASTGHRQAANKWRYSVRGEGIYYSYLKDDRWMQREQSSASIMHLLASYLFISHLASAVVRRPPAAHSGDLSADLT